VSLYGVFFLSFTLTHIHIYIYIELLVYSIELYLALKKFCVNFCILISV
jgi:hypothetical protein